MPALEMASEPTTTKGETAQTMGVLEELLKNLSVSKTADEAKETAVNIGTLLSGPIEEHDVPIK